MQKMDDHRKPRRSGGLCVLWLLAVLCGASRPAAAQAININPFLDCVEVNAEAGTFTAYFGYESFEAGVVTVPVSIDNRFVPNPADRGQPTLFFPGLHERAFRVTSSAGMIWNFKDFQMDALSTSKPCSATTAPGVQVRRIVPFVERVTVDSANNQATATFGYFNNSASAVTLAVGPQNLLSGQLASPQQPTDFQPGLQRNVFSVTFSLTTDKAMFWLVEGWPALAVPGLTNRPALRADAPAAAASPPK